MGPPTLQFLRALALRGLLEAGYDVTVVDNLIKLQVIDKSVILESFGKYDDTKKVEIVKRALLLGNQDIISLLMRGNLIDRQFINQIITKCDVNYKIKIAINNIIFGNIDLAEKILREINSFPQIEISKHEKQIIFKQIIDKNKFFIVEKLFRLNLIKECDLESYCSGKDDNVFWGKSKIFLNEGNLFLLHIIKKLKILKIK
jgi:hypothetical protein